MRKFNSADALIADHFGSFSSSIAQNCVCHLLNRLVDEFAVVIVIHHVRDTTDIGRDYLCSTRGDSTLRCLPGHG